LKTYSFIEYPQEIHKKLLVFNHFKKHFESAEKGQNNFDNHIYVKKWIQTKQALFFRMSNQSMQISFKDNSILIINTKTKKLTLYYKDSSNTYPLEAVSTIENKDVAKRLKYTEEVLKTIWTNQTDGAPLNPSKNPLEEHNKTIKQMPLDNSAKTISTATTN